MSADLQATIHRSGIHSTPRDANWSYLRLLCWMMFALFVSCNLGLMGAMNAVADDTAVSAVDDAPVDDQEFEQARVHLQKGRIGEALEAYGRLEKAGRDPVQIALGRNLAAQAEGRWQDATVIINILLLDAAAQDAGVWARSAELNFLQGRYDGALAACEESLKLDPDQPLARLVQADIWAETGHTDEADAGYRWFVRYYNRQQPKDAETLLLVARGAAEYARWHSASQIFDFVVNTLCPDVLADDENCWQARALAGQLLLEKYNSAQAAGEFKKALAINPRATSVLTAMGEAALQGHDTDESGKLAERALAINPHDVAALQLKAATALYVGDVPKALGVIDEALAVQSRDQRTRALQAGCYLLKDGIPSPDALQKLLAEVDTADRTVSTDASRFEKLLAQVSQQNPRPAGFLTELAMLLEHRRQYPAAERLYRQAMQLMPQLSAPKTALGLLYMQVGRTDEAREILDAAFEADPYHVRVSNMRKVIRLLDGYESISTDHFVIRFDSQADKILAEYMAEYLEEQYPILVAQFGYEPQQRTRFEIYHHGKGLSAHQWFSARMVGLPWVQTIGASTGVIVALASPTASREAFNWARVVKHEFVHVITLQQTQFNIPHWFTEALAVASEGFPRPEIWDDLLLERVPRGELMNLDNLNQGFIRAQSSLDWQFAYCQSRLYAQFMVEKYGSQTISQMLECYRENLSTEAAIRRVFGIDKAEFEQGYRAFLDDIVAELGTANDEAAEPSFPELERAYREDKEDAHKMAAYAYALLKARRRRQARELAEQAWEKNPQEPLAAVTLAELKILARDLDGAEKYLLAAFDKNKLHRKVLQMLAYVQFRNRDYEAAAESYKLGRQSYPRESRWTQGLAAVYARTDNVAELIPLLKLLAAGDPDDVVVRKKLAELAIARADFDEARVQARDALYIDVLDPEIHVLLGQAYLGLKDFAHAAREYRVAGELKPDDAEISLALARTLVADGQTEPARKILQELLERQPDEAAAQELLETLKGKRD